MLNIPYLICSRCKWRNEPPLHDISFLFIQILDDDGLASPGEIIRPHDIYINKESPVVTRGPIVSPMGLADRSFF